MKKKIFSLILLFSCTTLMTGCDDVKDLTDEETGLIAEYAAEMLLKYDLSYTDRIVEGERETKDMAAKEELSTQENSTEDVTSEDVDTEAKGIQDSSKKETSDDKADTDDGTGDMENPVRTENEIAKILGVSGASITCKDYLITDHYLAEGESAAVEASEGHQLLVVRFNVANVTQDTVNVTLLDKEIDYRLVCNGNKAADPMLTILVEDLKTLEASIAPKEEQEAVLIFQISESMKDSLESIELNIHYDDKNNAVKIL